MPKNKEKPEKESDEKINENLDESGDSKEPKKFQMSRDQEIWFHQGALNSLINERNELIRVIQNAEQIMHAHIKRLEELGIKVKTGKQE